jgi:hypothetical protein
MIRVLVPTYPKDVHAAEVALALRARGHEAVLWYGSDFPTLQSAAIEIRDGALGWEMRGAGLAETHPPFDVVWLRRPTSPVFPNDIHPADLPVARRETRDFLAGLVHLAAPDAFWVNPLASRPRSELKAVQLREAARAGLAVPPTLMSNDPERIRRFLGELPGGAIYKPFNPVQWESDEEVAVLWTNEITADDLPEDDILRLTPGIFQAKVEKAHELRVTVMGRHVVTARLLSQELPDAQLDWRAGGSKLRVEPDRLPAEVERACLDLQRRLGLVFGCFDFIVTPEGRHVFLEVNPAGQFLWVEEANPDIPMLAPFVDFLLAQRADFEWRPGASPIRHTDFHPAALEAIAAAIPLHVEAEATFVEREERENEGA